MSLTRWLSNQLGWSSRAASRRRTSGGRTTFRPALETLEHRWVPSTLSVLNNGDSGANSLRAAITAAHNGDTIKFAPSMAGQTITLTTGELLIKQNLTIAGPGAGQLTVSGNNASRVFEVAKNATVALSGLTISNGYVVSALAKSGYDTTNGRGAGILNHGVLTVSGSTLSYNKASSGSGGSFDGGGINNDGTLTVNNSAFTYNTAGGGGGIYNERGGKLTVSNSTLSYNTAYEGGGIGSESTAAISGCQLLNNTVAGSGGGIANWASMTVSGCTISSNIATTTPGGSFPGEGGGIYASSTYYTTNTLTVTGCTLSDNSATGAGGGIYVGNGTVNVTNGSVLSGNSGTLGGGIYVYYATLTVSGSTLSNNSAATDGGGGGIYILRRFQSPVTISGSVFAGNTSGPASARTTSSACGPTGAATPSANGKFAPCRNKTAGAVLPRSELRTGPASPRRSVCAPNAVAFSSYRRPTPDRRCTMRLFSWLRKPSRAAIRPAPRARPGVETLEDRCVPSVLPVTSTLDDATRRGTLRYAVAQAQSGDTILLTGAVAHAGITLSQGELILTQQNLTIQSAAAPVAVTIRGGNLSRVFEVAAGASVTLRDLDVTGGNGLAGVPDRPHDGRGGGILVDEGAALTIRSSAVSNNSAAVLGGGIADYGTLTVFGGTVSDNQALGTYGGGIAVFSGAPFSAPFSATLSVSDSILSDNTALQNGGAITGVFSTVALNNCMVTGNSAAVYDGGGLNNHGGTLTVNHCRVADNTAANGVGGGIINYTGTLTVNGGSVVDGNTAHSGGGIDNSGTLTMLDSRLSNNTVPHYDLGGGLFNEGPATATMTDDTLTGNTAGLGGGVLSIGALTMSHCMLSDNTATYSSGGAIANYGTLVVKDHSVLSHNSAYYGGAIANGGTATIVDSILDRNTTLEYGQGGAIANDGTLTICGSAITNNTADWGGGIDNDYGSATLTNCLVSGNTAIEFGGGILNDDTMAIDHCTVTGNTDSWGGGGIANDYLLTVSNSVFSANTPDNIFGGYTDGGGNTFM